MASSLTTQRTSPHSNSLSGTLRELVACPMMETSRRVSVIATTVALFTAAMVEAAYGTSSVRHWNAVFTFDGQLEPVPTPLTIVQMDDLAIATRIKFSQVAQDVGLDEAIHVQWMDHEGTGVNGFAVTIALASSMSDVDLARLNAAIVESLPIQPGGVWHNLYPTVTFVSTDTPAPTAPTPAPPLQCGASVCMNGGVCIIDGDTSGSGDGAVTSSSSGSSQGQVCLCPQGFGGDRCEEVLTSPPTADSQKTLPTDAPIAVPTTTPTDMPASSTPPTSVAPTTLPTVAPTHAPTVPPTTMPTTLPTSSLTSVPTLADSVAIVSCPDVLEWRVPLPVEVLVYTNLPPQRAVVRVVVKALNASGHLLNISEVADVSLGTDGVLVAHVARVSVTLNQLEGSPAWMDLSQVSQPRVLAYVYDSGSGLLPWESETAHTVKYLQLPTWSPTEAPTAPTALPTVAPTVQPSVTPTLAPTTSPTGLPTASPTASPSESPTSPTAYPTKAPTLTPSVTPTVAPSMAPTHSPTDSPTNSPSVAPSHSPSESPTAAPSMTPTHSPTDSPTDSPTTSPTAVPTAMPSNKPTASPVASPTVFPTVSPTAAPSSPPTLAPSLSPTTLPTMAPATLPTAAPTELPSNSPSHTPSASPTMPRSEAPSTSPTSTPSVVPTFAPTSTPSESPRALSTTFESVASTVDVTTTRDTTTTTAPKEPSLTTASSLVSTVTSTTSATTRTSVDSTVTLTATPPTVAITTSVVSTVTLEPTPPTATIATSVDSTVTLTPTPPTASITTTSSATTTPTATESHISSPTATPSVVPAASTTTIPQSTSAVPTTTDVHVPDSADEVRNPGNHNNKSLSDAMIAAIVVAALAVCCLGGICLWLLCARKSDSQNISSYDVHYEVMEGGEQVFESSNDNHYDFAAIEEAQGATEAEVPIAWDRTFDKGFAGSDESAGTITVWSDRGDESPRPLPAPATRYLDLPHTTSPIATDDCELVEHDSSMAEPSSFIVPTTTPQRRPEHGGLLGSRGHTYTPDHALLAYSPMDGYASVSPSNSAHARFDSPRLVGRSFSSHSNL